MIRLVIDVHHHVLPPFYMEAIRDCGFDRTGGIRFPSWEVADSLRVMDTHRIETAVLSLSTPGVAFLQGPAEARHLARRVNEWMAEVVAAHPGRFAALATLPLPDVDGARTEIDHALDTLDLAGVTLLTSAGGRYLGDPAFDPVMAALDQRAAVAFIHPTTPPGGPPAGLDVPVFAVEFVADTTRALANLILTGALERHPHVRLVCAHGGGFAPYITDRLEAAWRRERRYQEAAPAGPTEYLRRLRYDTAAVANPYALPALLALARPGSVLLGTDHPFVPEAALATAVDQAPPGDPAVLDRLFRRSSP